MKSLVFKARAVQFHPRAAAACIIDTIGSRLPEEVSSLIENLLRLGWISV